LDGDAVIEQLEHGAAAEVLLVAAEPQVILRWPGRSTVWTPGNPSPRSRRAGVAVVVGVG